MASHTILVVTHETIQVQMLVKSELCFHVTALLISCTNIHRSNVAIDSNILSTIATDAWCTSCLQLAFRLRPALVVCRWCVSDGGVEVLCVLCVPGMPTMHISNSLPLHRQTHPAATTVDNWFAHSFVSSHQSPPDTSSLCPCGTACAPLRPLPPPRLPRSPFRAICSATR